MIDLYVNGVYKGKSTPQQIQMLRKKYQHEALERLRSGELPHVVYEHRAYKNSLLCAVWLYRGVPMDDEQLDRLSRNPKYGYIGAFHKYS